MPASIRGAGSSRRSTTARGPTPSQITIGGPRGLRDSPSRWFLVPRRHSADGRHAGAARQSGPQRRWRGTRRRSGRQRAVGDPGWIESHGAARSVAADDRVSGDRDLRRQGGDDHPDLCRSAPRAGKGRSRRARRATGTILPAKCIAGLADRFLPDGGERRAVPATVVADVSVRAGRGRDRGRAADRSSDIRASFSAYPSSRKGQLRGQRPDAAAHLRRRLAHGAALRARNLHGHARTGSSSSTSATRASRRSFRCTCPATIASCGTRSSCSTSRASLTGSRRAAIRAIFRNSSRPSRSSGLG